MSTGQQPEPPAQEEPQRRLRYSRLDVDAEMERIRRTRRWALALFILTLAILVAVLVFGFVVVRGLPDDQRGLAGLSWLAMGVAALSLLLLAGTTIPQLLVHDPFPPERASLAIMEAQLATANARLEMLTVTSRATVTLLTRLVERAGGPAQPPPEP